MQSINPPLGIIMMVAAMSVNSTKDGFAKLLAASYTPLTLLLIQFVFTGLIMAPLVISKNGPQYLIPTRLPLQILRGAFVTVGVGLYYWAINFIHVVDATAMVFVAPLIVTALSPFILNEPIGIRRITAVAIGFIGVLIILRPSLEGDRFGYFVALASGFFLAGFYMANRKLSDTSPILASTYYTALIGTILLLPFMVFFWTTPTSDDLALLFGFASLATVGQILMVGAFSFAAANIIAPYLYSQIIAATLVGVILFDALPDQWTWVGIAIVVASGLYIAIREINIKKG